jgi:hypothetical protein
VSSLISQQLNEWTFAFAEDRERLQSFPFRPLDTKVISWHLASEVRLVEETKKRSLVEAGADFLEIAYEELYDPVIPRSQRQDALDRVRTFLKVPLPGEPDILRDIDQRFDPHSNRINSKQTYSRIPGIAQVEERFGSDETGWLFK